MTPTDADLIREVEGMSAALDRRAAEHRRLEPYYVGRAPLPAAVSQARMTRAYRHLMPMADAPWGSLIVDSNSHRLEVTGLQGPDKAVADELWRVWQANKMDAESKLAHNAAFIDGRAFALVWPGDDPTTPEISLDDASQMIVRYREGSRHIREAALRRWIDDDDRAHATLYRRDGTYKFSAKAASATAVSTVEWVRRDDPADVEWPVPNDTGEVPVVELAVNRRLKPGAYGYARGEYAHVTGLIDRINLLTFLGLVVALWQGFPLRGVIGEAILKDDDGNAIPPFDANADALFQLENKDARIEQFDAADRNGLSVFADLDQLAVLTATPRHYFPMEGGMSNLSADAIRASEGAHAAKIGRSHKPALSEGYEEILRVAGLTKDAPVYLDDRAELQWADHESRSLAERGDVYSKLSDLPWQVKAEVALGANAEQIRRWSVSAASDPLSVLARAATTPATVAPPANGSVVPA